MEYRIVLNDLDNTFLCRDRLELDNLFAAMFLVERMLLQLVKNIDRCNDRGDRVGGCNRTMNKPLDRIDAREDSFRLV